MPIVTPTNDKKKVTAPPDSLVHAGDKLSREESFEYIAYKKQHNRREGILDLTYNNVSRILSIVSWLIISAIVIIAWHLMAPERLHWLSELQFDRLVTILSSVAVSTLVSAYFNSHLKK